MTAVEIIKQKAQKKCDIKRELAFEIYKSCLEACQIEYKTNRLEKNKIDIDGIKKMIKNS